MDLVLWIIIAYVMTRLVYRRNYKVRKPYLSPFVVGGIVWFFTRNSYGAFLVGGSSKSQAVQFAYMNGAALTIIIFGILFLFNLRKQNSKQKASNQMVEGEDVK